MKERKPALKPPDPNPEIIETGDDITDDDEALLDEVTSELDAKIRAKFEKKATDVEPPALVRLNKLLADRGVGPRRRCDELIASGAVEVDGEIIIKLGTKVDPESARIRVDGKVISSGPRVVYALHKPKGVVCTSAPEEKRLRAIDLVRDPGAARLFCVGRLDAESEGLIFLTNDGDLANRITHPRYEVSKTYFVKVRGRVTPEALQKAMDGIWLAEGKTSGSRIFVRKRLSTATVLLVTIREGMNREIRRVFAKLEFPVIDLKRVAIGPISLRGIRSGAYRRLTREEVKALVGNSDESPKTPKGTKLPRLYDAKVSKPSQPRSFGKKPFRRP